MKISINSKLTLIYGGEFLNLQFGELLVGDLLELQSPSKLVISPLVRLVGLLLATCAGRELEVHTCGGLAMLLVDLGDCYLISNCSLLPYFSSISLH